MEDISVGRIILRAIEGGHLRYWKEGEEVCECGERLWVEGVKYDEVFHEKLFLLIAGRYDHYVYTIQLRHAKHYYCWGCERGYRILVPDC